VAPVLGWRRRVSGTSAGFDPRRRRRVAVMLLMPKPPGNALPSPRQPDRRPKRR